MLIHGLEGEFNGDLDLEDMIDMAVQGSKITKVVPYLLGVPIEGYHIYINKTDSSEVIGFTVTVAEFERIADLF